MTKTEVDFTDGILREYREEIRKRCLLEIEVDELKRYIVRLKKESLF